MQKSCRAVAAVSVVHWQWRRQKVKDGNLPPDRNLTFSATGSRRLEALDSSLSFITNNPTSVSSGKQDSNGVQSQLPSRLTTQTEDNRIRTSLRGGNGRCDQKGTFVSEWPVGPLAAVCLSTSPPHLPQKKKKITKKWLSQSGPSTLYRVKGYAVPLTVDAVVGVLKRLHVVFFFFRSKLSGTFATTKCTFGVH